MKKLVSLLVTLSICSCASPTPHKRESAKAPVKLHQKYVAANGSYSAVTVNDADSQSESDVLLKSARISLKINQPEVTINTLSKMSNIKDLNLDQQVERERLFAEAYKAQKKFVMAVQYLHQLAEIHPSTTERERYKGQAIDIIDSQLSENELNEIVDNSELTYLRAIARLRFALIMIDQKNFSKARTSLSQVVDLAADGELRERANSLMNQLDMRSRIDNKTIGVVLPLSGKQSNIGYRALKGIQFGLGIFSRVPSNFRLAVIDSESNPDVARRAVERLVTEDHVIALIGGLLSKTASAEAAKAQELGVPTIMLSQKSGITQTGEFIFRNSLTSEMQIEHLVGVAINQLGMKSFAIMFPNDAYGIEFANLFWDEVLAQGGRITAAQTYDSKETDFRGPVQRLGSLFYIEDRMDEYRQKLAALTSKAAKRSVRQSSPTIEEVLPPIIDFDGVFIPDSARAVGLIAPMLAFNNINPAKVRLLGTNIWNSQTLVTRGQKYVDNSVFADVLQAGDRGFQNSQFFVEFKSLFDEEPGVVELQAYDSALMIRQLLAAGENTRIGLQQSLANLRNFTGGKGVLSVNSSREFLRPLSTLSIKDGKIGPLEAVTVTR
jgi:ABC-type branched-subunit amino acid transport system substrate-binding protein